MTMADRIKITLLLFILWLSIVLTAALLTILVMVMLE